MRTRPALRCWIQTVVLAAVVAVACSPAGRLAREPRKVEAQLKQAFVEWEGTPYKLGGQSKKGVDCSGFIQLVYREKFSVQLPRTTEDQIKTGRPVKKAKQLLPGDLVFFKTGKKQLHAGIVVRGNAFIHASTSNGVTVSELDNVYWRKVFLRARRVLY